MITRLLILGGGSDLAAAFTTRAVDAGLGTVVLAGRAGGSRDETASRLAAEHPDLVVRTASFDGSATSTHAERLVSIDEDYGPFDAVMVAFGQLGAPFTLDLPAHDAAEVAHLNYTGALSASLAAVNILRGEPNARLIIFSSITAVRPRVGNLVYGSAKAGLDAFARELTGPASELGIDVIVVRPGFVHTRMTDGLEPAPFATTADAVAQDLITGIEKGRSVIHSPATLGPVGLVLKNLPTALWRRLSKR